MQTRSKYFFEDGVSYADRSSFVDYPVVKIRSRNSAGRFFGKILIYISFFVLTSAVFLII
jgi:hypothetical protein